MLRAEDYTYKINWLDSDQVFVARVVELPLLSAHGETEEEALESIYYVVNSVLECL